MGMERYRAIVKLEEIRSYYEKGDFAAAKELADSIRKERLRDSSDLFLLAAVYRKCGDYAAAKEFLYRIYEKKITWRVLEELMEVCLAEKNPEEANSYLKEYARLSGGDPRNYIYEYRIGRQLHRPEEELLPLLQTLKAEEYSEKYAYELAKLYHKLGREEECMAECADLILWFGEGTYVERAKALRAYYRGELSAEEIREEANRRVREAEEQHAAGEAEQKAYREEQKRLAKEAQMEIEAELHRFEEEDRQSRLEEPRRFEEYEEQDRADAELQKALEEAAAADMTVQEEALCPETVEPEKPEEALHPEMAVPEETMYPAARRPEEPSQESLQGMLQEPRPFTEPSGELAARLKEKEIILEEALHEFARMESVRKQLLRMLEMVLTVRKRCHCLIITGEKGCGKTTLGTYLTKLLYELSYVKSPRVAKINAAKLTGRKLEEKKEQLRDCCLIVEEAGMLSEEAATALLDFIAHAGVLGTVILEDNPNAMSKFLRMNAECNRVFNNRVHLPKYGTEELLEFALGYIEEQGYKIDREAYQIMKEKVEQLTRTGQKEGRLAQTMKLVKQAIGQADYRNQGTIFAMANTGNFLAAGEMELTAEDFGVIR